jgi:tRNA-guanine family transglycosylase
VKNASVSREEYETFLYDYRAAKARADVARRQLEEMLAGTLLSIHNLHTLLQLTRDMRQAILNGQFDTFAKNYLDRLHQSTR